MSCPRCLADPQPAHYGDPRRCAFDEGGRFDPGNWNCATVSELICLGEQDGSARVYGDNQSLDYVRAYVLDDPGYHEGWLVLTRYKERGRCSSITWVGDFWPPREVRLSDVEAVLQAAKQVRS